MFSLLCLWVFFALILLHWWYTPQLKHPLAEYNGPDELDALCCCSVLLVSTGFYKWLCGNCRSCWVDRAGIEGCMMPLGWVD